MIVPGSNILNQALLAIAQQSFQWLPFAARVYQPNGQWLSAYSTPLNLRGSVQAVARNLYQQYGLDFDKFYQKFYVSSDIIDVDRDVSGDLFTFQGATFQCLSITPWYGIDGWVEVLAVRVVNTPICTGISAPASGTYNHSSGAVLTFTLQFNQPVVVSGTPYLALSALSGVIGGNAAYTGGSGGSQLTFAYTVASTDTASGIAVTPPAQGIITNAAGNIPANACFVAPSLTGIILN